MPQREVIGLTLAALSLLACADPASGPAPDVRAAPSRASFDLAPASLAWQAQARSLVAAGGLSALAAARVYAALGVAQYAAVVEADHGFETDGLLPQNGLGEGGRSLLEARRGAVAGASAVVLKLLFGEARGAEIDALAAAQASAGPGGVHPQFTRGQDAGRLVGATMAARLASDRFTAPWTGSIPVDPIDSRRIWRPAATGTPVGVMLSGMTPYALTSASQFRPRTPPTLGEAEFQAATAEVLAIATARSPTELLEVVRWNYGGGTFTPPGYWNLIASEYVATYAWDERAATHLFAVMHAAVMDALIACWEAKYFYLTPRPSQADGAITARLGLSLPNHPSYPSGHSCASEAAAAVLGTHFPDRTTELAGWVTDAGNSRILAGIHYRFDITAGNVLGRNVANWVMSVDASGGLLALLR